jgi:hypothetical protein
MGRDYEQELDEHLERVQRRLPRRPATFLGWLWQPRFHWVRIPVAVLLILGGLVGFLPVLGFWMVPLGLAVMAKDIPLLQPALVRCLDWAERKWPAKTKK